MSKRKKSSNQNFPSARLAGTVQSSLLFNIMAGAALLIVAAFLVYLPSLSGGFIWDDDSYVTQNRFIRAPDGLYKFWCSTEPVDYYPISNTMLWFEWRLWGINAAGYHAVSLIMHIAHALLIWIILRKLSIPGAFLAAMIFAVHPVNVEAVAWIAQRKDMLAFLFFLLSILFYLKADMQSPTDQYRLYRPGAGRWYWLSLAAFVLAMLSKGSVAMLPVLLLGIVWWLRPLTRRDMLRSAPLFTVALVLTGVHVWFQTHGSGEVIRNASFTERLLGAGGVVWFYLYKALLPLNLAFIYPQWHIDVGNLLWWLPLSAAAALTAALWRYRQSWGRPLLFAWGFFCVALVPVMGFTDAFFMRYSLVADHYQHIAIIGVIALVAAIWSAWHLRTRGGARLAATVLAVVTVGVLALFSGQQCGIYSDELTLYQDTLKKNPDCWMALNNLGTTLARSGRLSEAIEHFQQSLALKSDYPEVHNNMGAALIQSGRLPEAIEHFQQALQIKSNDFEAHYHLGNVSLQTAHMQEAEEHFRQALSFNPSYPEAHNNLGAVLARTGRRIEAIEHYEKALQLDPDFFDARFNLGNVFKAMGQYPQAIEHYEKALALKPESPEAHINLGITLVETGRPLEAIEYFKQAVNIRPDYISAWNNLALAYALTQQFSEAVAAAQKALDLARSQRQAAQAKQIEDWLNSYQGQRAWAKGSEGTKNQ